MTDVPGVTAVVVNFNGGENITRCVQALHVQSHPLTAIIIVDNGSTDGSREQVATQYPATQIIALGENRGLSTARNVGLDAVESEFALLVDDDVYVRHDTIASLLAVAQAATRTIVCPRIMLYPAGEIVQAQGAFVHFAGLLRLHHGYQPVAKVTEEIEEVGGCIGACYFGRTADFTTPGGFDELMFFYFEDMEFSLRLRALGSNFVAVPDAVVDHDRGVGTVGLSFRGEGSYPRRRAYYSMRHRWLTLLIHYQWRSLLLLAPSLFVYELLNLAFLATHGWGRDGWRAVRWLWHERHAVRQRRRRMQANRVRRDRALLVAGKLPFAPGLIRSRWLNVFVRVMTSVFNLNWRMVRRFL